jgi:PAS domain-containing protein
MDEQTDGELRALIQAPRGSREATELLSALERESVHAEVSESASHSAELFAREPYDFYFVGESQAEEIDLGVAERPSVTLVLVGDICLPSLVRLTDPGRSDVLARTRVLPFGPNSNSRSISVGPLLAEKRDDYRRRAEQSIYRDMLRNTDSVVIRLDLEGRITFANQAIQSVLGVDMGEAVGADAFATVLKLPEEREDI